MITLSLFRIPVTVSSHGLQGLTPRPNTAETFSFIGTRPRNVVSPHTAIPADRSRQSLATVPVTHYFDVKRQCRDCGKPFIFFAEEQKHWYEELGFALESDCVRCVVCRKKQQGLERKRERYEELFHISARTIEQDLEIVDCCLSLVEASVFHKRQLQHMRMILKKLPSELTENSQTRFNDLWSRLLALETETHG
jgi:hypothetical protein